jgi:hypothetical protein
VGLVLLDAGEQTSALDKSVYESGTLAAAIGAREQPGFTPERDPAQGPLHGVVGDAATSESGSFPTYRGTRTKSALRPGTDIGMGEALVGEFTV